MKTVATVLLILAISHVAFCRPTIDQVINTAVPQILQKGVNKGVLSAGGYYLHHIIESSTPSDKLYNLHLHIRGVNNQTRLDLHTTVDNDFNIKSWYYNYSIIKGTRYLGEGLGFAWLNYASSSTGEFCPNLGTYEEAEQLIAPRRNLASADNLKVRSSFKDVYDFGLEQHGDFLLPPSENWLPYTSSYQIGIRFQPDHYVLAYSFMQLSTGIYERSITIFNVYQPCSGKIYSYATTFDSRYDI